MPRRRAPLARWATSRREARRTSSRRPCGARSRRRLPKGAGGRVLQERDAAEFSALLLGGRLVRLELLGQLRLRKVGVDERDLARKPGHRVLEEDVVDVLAGRAADLLGRLDVDLVEQRRD